MSCWAIISILRWFFGGGWLMVFKNEYCMLPPSCYTPLLFFCDCFVKYIMSNCFWEKYTPQIKDSGMNQARIFYVSCNWCFVSASDQTTGSSPKSWFSREIPSTCFNSVPKKLLAIKKSNMWNNKNWVVRWWFSKWFIFTSYLDNWSHLANIFQMGWNHQLGWFANNLWWFNDSMTFSGLFFQSYKGWVKSGQLWGDEDLLCAV